MLFIPESREFVWQLGEVVPPFVAEHVHHYRDLFANYCPFWVVSITTAITGSIRATAKIERVSVPKFQPDLHVLISAKHRNHMPINYKHS